VLAKATPGIRLNEHIEALQARIRNPGGPVSGGTLHAAHFLQ